MKLTIQAMKAELTQDEMMEKIPQSLLSKVRGKGAMKAYALAHEGTSTPKSLNKESIPLRWTRAVIRRLADKVNEGVKFFVEHGKNTNSHESRKPVGEVVSSFVKDIGGKLTNIVIGYFPNENEIEDMSTCSMEASVRNDDSDQGLVSDINDISGIALGNLDYDKPAFQNAMALSTIQCFGADTKEEENNMAEIKLSDVKEYIATHKISPRALFNLDDIQEDSVFGKIYEEKSIVEAKVKTLEQTNTDLEKQNTDAIKANKKAEASAKIESLLKEGFTDTQKTFIKKRFNPDNMADDALTEEGLKKYIESEKTEFAETAKLFGTKGNDDNSSSESASAGDGDTDAVAEALKDIGA